MNFATIKNCDIANGPGVRVSLFVSGCTHRCEGCFNEVAWDFAYGEPFTREVEDTILEALAPDFIAGLTLLGGEPFEPENQAELLPLIDRYKRAYPGKNLWMFTGYILERDLVPGGRKYIDTVTPRILESVDVLVDGPFILEKRDLTLKFRGSSNQRLLRREDIRKLLA